MSLVAHPVNPAWTSPPSMKRKLENYRSIQLRLYVNVLFHVDTIQVSHLYIIYQYWFI
jgi:hypothetical protein